MSKFNKHNMLQQIENFNNGLYDSPDFTTQCEAGWYDWFCKDSSLANKTNKLYKKLIRVVKANEMSSNKKFDPENTYVFFKNNCPIEGKLYDDFRICDLETGGVIFTISPSLGYDSCKGKAELYNAGYPNADHGAIEGIEKFKDIVNWFKN